MKSKSILIQLEKITIKFKENIVITNCFEIIK